MIDAGHARILFRKCFCFYRGGRKLNGAARRKYPRCTPDSSLCHSLKRQGTVWGTYVSSRAGCFPTAVGDVLTETKCPRLSGWRFFLLSMSLGCVGLDALIVQGLKTLTIFLVGEVPGRVQRARKSACTCTYLAPATVCGGRELFMNKQTAALYNSHLEENLIS